MYVCVHEYNQYLRRRVLGIKSISIILEEQKVFSTVFEREREREKKT